MSTATDEAFGPEIIALASEAFRRSWHFIEADPVLAGCDRKALQAELARSILDTAKNGERDLVRIANRAIGRLRATRPGQNGR